MTKTLQKTAPGMPTGTSDPIRHSRREFVTWAAKLSAGASLASLTACGSSTADTLPEAPVLESRNGVLSLDLVARYAPKQMTVAYQQLATYPGPASVIAAQLRSFDGRSPAPTLRLKPRDMLRIRLINDLPPSPAGQSSLAYLNHQNSTNLHFHGLHVDPKEIRPGVFGDYMVDTSDAGVGDGQARQHEIVLPDNHASGIYWYHPHLHGATTSQVASGMFGAILIHDPADPFAASPEISERIIFVHKLTLNAQGRTDSFYDSLQGNDSGFLLNGAYQPTLVMRPGEVQIWHFINSGFFYGFNPVLDGHTMQAFARDGNTFAKRFQAIDAGNSADFSNQRWPGNAIYPGGRLSVVVQASTAPGTYYLRSAPVPLGVEEIVARVLVEGPRSSTVFPLASDLRQPADQVLPISDQELRDKGGVQRSFVLAVLFSSDAQLPQPQPPGEEWFIPRGDGAGAQETKVFATGDGAPGEQLLAPYQSSLAKSQTVHLDAVEEWTVYNLAGSYPHPFHVHVNECCVVKVNGDPVTPFWADTLPVPAPIGDVPGSITFRIRFTDFTGKFVWHCHALDHEDMGMMQNVEVV
jgi:FtsP/CotA-like multicopper oxidase with cupredoxin domain